jgi:hypothetical protein
MENQSAMGRFWDLVKPAEEQEYSPLDDVTEHDDDEVHRPVLILPDDEYPEAPFSWFEYCIFFLLGISMLWAWYVYTSGSTRL